MKTWAVGYEFTAVSRMEIEAETKEDALEKLQELTGGNPIHDLFDGDLTYNDRNVLPYAEDPEENPI